MERVPVDVPWARGSAIVRREITWGRPTSALPAFVVDDTDELLALFVPPDAPLAYADVVWPTDTGRHPWWPGRHWRSGGTLMVQRPGEAYSVWHQWASLDRSFLGWYVNLQEPLRRTPIGVDTQDHELDVVVAPDGTWQVKDAALVARRVEEGRITEATGAAIHQLGDEVVATLARGDAWWGRRWVDWRPDPAWTAPANVRDDWERVPWVDGRTVSA